MVRLYIFVKFLRFSQERMKLVRTDTALMGRFSILIGWTDAFLPFVQASSFLSTQKYVK